MATFGELLQNFFGVPGLKVKVGELETKLLSLEEKVASLGTEEPLTEEESAFLAEAVEFVKGIGWTPPTNT